jgi:hypothetical protein
MNIELDFRLLQYERMCALVDKVYGIYIIGDIRAMWYWKDFLLNKWDAAKKLNHDCSEILILAPNHTSEVSIVYIATNSCLY